MGVVIPIRSFRGAKERLAGRLSDVARADLARDLATRVVRAAAPLPVAVVSSAPEVRAWALEVGAEVLDDPGTGLDAAAAAGSDHLGDRGFRRAIVAHADLPDAGPLAPLAEGIGLRDLVLVPCHRDDGTNVCSIPLPRTFPFSYGPGSFRRHQMSAQELGLDVVVVRRVDLAFDIDVPDDYDLLLARSRA
ncbi:MAG TPA: 2-phospho-L-lactate guanylyltransferase [Acidimicrobiia bacterium]|nr:2-phospho-L-lactate guanylyltransferase [Acidimicrobiia bacterium]